jgi:hypothetical protein
LITEVQTGFIDSNGQESPRQEFVELTNVSPSKVNVTNWTVEYLSSANNGSGAPTSVLATLSGQINLNGQVLLNHVGYNPANPDVVFGEGDTASSGLIAKSGGHIRIMKGSTMIDCVAWGSAVAIAGCDKVAAAAPAGYTLQRPLTEGFYDKTRGVANFTPPTPNGGSLFPLTSDPPILPPPADPEPNPSPVPSCDNILLSEILANPTGDDAQGEFIELHNPTGITQSLYGCSLRLSNGKEYAFSATDFLTPNEYRAFPYSTTKLQLGNSGSTVSLMTATQQLSTTYPALGDDESWSFIDGDWYSTSHPTPNAVNVLDQGITSVGTTTSILVAAIEPCPVGKYRNPTTNRCRNIVAPTPAAAICTPRQERNPATGRCRKITSPTVQAACQVNQERNPETGRCRKVNVAATPKACDPGQERNPDTGRCRKATQSPAGKVLGATITKKTYHLLLIGVILVGVTGYGFYEYRHGLSSLLNRLRHRRVTS